MPNINLTRCELQIWTSGRRDRRFFPADSAVDRIGSGSSRKVRILLAAAPTIAAYGPVDISSQMLVQRRQSLRRYYRCPRLAVLASRPFHRVSLCRRGRRELAHTFFPCDHRKFRAA